MTSATRTSPVLTYSTIHSLPGLATSSCGGPKVTVIGSFRLFAGVGLGAFRHPTSARRSNLRTVRAVALFIEIISQKGGGHGIVTRHCTIKVALAASGIRLFRLVLLHHY